MKIAKFEFPGKALTESGVTAIVMKPDSSEDGPRVSLALALVTFGVEEQLFPASLLDDWGNEVSGKAIYPWVSENGLQFPRAEVFGLDPHGQERQRFLRDFDLLATKPCYLLLDGGPEASLPVQAILFEGNVTEPTRLEEAPEGVSGALRQARVEWWRVPAGLSHVAFLQPPEA